jgi:branched-chain amino acid transport system substrate-binding protein
MYSAAMWIDQALAKTGVPKDPLDLINAVKSIELTDAPRGALKIDDHNSTIETVYIRNTVKTEGGGMMNEVIDKIDNVSQFWTFTPEEYMARPPYSRDYPPLDP